MRRRLLLLLTMLAVALAAIGVGVVAGPAAADCIGPTIEFEPAEAPRGGEVTVVGTGFGDNCYDTGPPPDGEGVLGVPQRDVQVLLVQGAGVTLVAKGDADAEYGFEVTIVVPAALLPGPVVLVARTADGREAFAPQTDTLLVTDAPPVDGAAEGVVAFGGDEPGVPSPSDEVGDEADDGPPWELIGLGLVVVALVAAVAYPISRRR